MDSKELKLTLKKAIFTGKTFLRHTESITKLIDPVSDEELEEFFDMDEATFNLLEQWEELRENLADLAS